MMYTTANFNPYLLNTYISTNSFYNKENFTGADASKKRISTSTDASKKDIRITIIPNDNEYCELDVDASIWTMSGHLVREVEDSTNSEEPIKIMASEATLRSVLEWCRHHGHDPEFKYDPFMLWPTLPVEVPEWDAEFFDSLTVDEREDIILAGDDLEIVNLWQYAASCF